MTHIAQGEARFRDLGIAKNFLSILEKHNFIKPTPIQHQAIPPLLEGKDVVGIAQTGTGKTLAFGIPLLQQLAIRKGQGLVILPTRELALQVDEVLHQIGKPLGLKTSVLIGGAAMGRQVRELKRNPHVIVATPGRLADHIKQGNVVLNKMSVVVLDEADRMLDVGFLPEINRILSGCPKNRQTVLFSATMPSAIAKIASQHMKTPLRIEVAPQGTSAKKVEQELFIVSKPDKIRLLDKVLAEHEGSTIVFSRTKFGAKKIARKVRAMGHTATEIHSNKSLNQRKKALAGFKSGEYRVMVATDIAARGIDVDDIKLVVNFDLPDNSEDYVHRIGRTGRAGKEGKAISFATHDQKKDVKQIERLIRKSLPLMKAGTLPEPRAPIHEPRSFRGGRTRGKKSRKKASHGGHYARKKSTGNRYGRSSRKPRRAGASS